MPRIKVFTDRFPLVGPSFWLSNLQYYWVQAAVAAAWYPPYSLRNNAISDLGNTTCGAYDGRYVCSPLHGLMNLSFITVGLTMAAGAGLVYQEFRETPRTRLAFSLMAAAGLGAVIVGLAPENVHPHVHLAGAAMSFLLGNLSLVLLGLILPLPRAFRWLTAGLGLVALTALGLEVAGLHFGLGDGGMERLVSYPQTLWIIIFGAYVMHNHYRRRR